MLIPLEDLEVLLRESQSAGEHWLVNGSAYGFKRGLLKLNGSGANEVLGYRVAKWLGVPVPRFSGSMLHSSRTVDDREFSAGLVGLVVEYFDDWTPVSRGEAAAVEPSGFARALALCSLNSAEWGEFGITGGQVKFIDLEWLFPLLNSVHLLTATASDRKAYLASSVKNYRAGIPVEIAFAIEEARSYGVLREFRSAMLQLEGLSEAEWTKLFDLTPHPFANEMARAAHVGTKERVRAAIRLLEL